MCREFDPHIWNPDRRAVCESTTSTPSVLHTHRFVQRIVQEKAPSIYLIVVRRLVSTPRRSTHEPLVGSRGCTLPRQCCLLRARVLLKGPWFVLGESCLEVSMMNNPEHLLTTLPPIFVDFWLLKVCQIGLGTLAPPRTSLRTSWTFLDVLVPRLPKWPIFII